MPRTHQKEEEVLLGVVSDRYEPYQNKEAFKFFDGIVDRKAAFFETAGALGEGERVWVMAKMPDAIQVVRGDECQKYLLLSNSHNGQGSVIVKFTAIRVVCQNTLMLAMDDGQPAFRVRHSRAMTERLEELAELISAAKAVYEEAAQLFRKLANIQLKRDVLPQYLEMVFPQTRAQKKKGERPPKWEEVLRILDTSPDLQLSGVRGTLWAAYNAVTRFEDYRPVKDETSDARLDRVWFGAGADLKLRALQTAEKLAKVS
jgi:phage/plasmid-like protein (TIGR03299 family)